MYNKITETVYFYMIQECIDLQKEYGHVFDAKIGCVTAKSCDGSSSTKISQMNLVDKNISLSSSQGWRLEGLTKYEANYLRGTVLNKLIHTLSTEFQEGIKIRRKTSKISICPEEHRDSSKTPIKMGYGFGGGWKKMSKDIRKIIGDGRTQKTQLGKVWVRDKFLFYRVTSENLVDIFDLIKTQGLTENKKKIKISF